MDHYMEVLRTEYGPEAADDAFVNKLRLDLNWDEKAFSRLTQAMRAYCEDHGDEPLLERWLAELFWFVPHFTRHWTSHPDFRPRNPGIDYEKSYEFLDDLAYWFFMGYSSYEKKP